VAAGIGPQLKRKPLGCRVTLRLILRSTGMNTNRTVVMPSFPYPRSLIVRPRAASFSLLLAALSCSDGIAPKRDLSGMWTTGMAPSGAYTELYLTTTGPSVTGTARWQHGLSNGPLVIYSVTGRQSSVTFTLTLTPDSGAVAAYVGRLIEPDQLTGTWSEADTSWTWSFTRMNVVVSLRQPNQALAAGGRVTKGRDSSVRQRAGARS
jgi:hypothetical protein